MPSDFTVQFYGCRGSFPVSGAQHQRYGGSTPCVVVRAGTRTIVLDGGSGLVKHGQDVIKESFAAGPPIETFIFISHLHLDHVLGLPFFGPMYIPTATVNMFGPRMGAYPSFEDAISTLIHPPFFPVPLYEMQSLKNFRDITEAHAVYFLKGQSEPIMERHSHPKADRPNPEDVEVEVRCMRGFNHPKSGVLLYKVTYDGRSVVYASDTEGYVHGDQRLTKFAMGADVLIHDAMYTSDRYISMPSPTQGYGHSTVEIAAKVAERAGVKDLFLFHHDPASSDEDLDAVGELGRSFFANTHLAADGLIHEL